MVETSSQTVEELLKKVEEFEKTIMGLLENVRNFKKKITENEAKYGKDISKWPGN